MKEGWAAEVARLFLFIYLGVIPDKLLPTEE